MNAQAGVIGHEAGDGAGGGTQRGRVAVADLLRDRPADDPGSRRDHGVGEGDRCRLVGTQGRAGVEPEPAEVQQAGAEQHQRQAVRLHLGLGPAHALAQHDRQGQAGGTGVDVDRGSTGEVLDAQAGEPAVADAVELGAAEVEHPVRDREVHDRDPDGGEDAPGQELGAVGDRHPRSAPR